MKKSILHITLTILVAAVLTVLLPSTSSAEETESIDDVLTAFDIALDTEDWDAIEDMIHPEYGLVVAGVFIERDEFSDLIHDRSSRPMELRRDSDTVTRSMSFEDLFWSDTGVLTRLTDATLTHYRELERDEITSEDAWSAWEHGEFEAAVVSLESDRFALYIPPVTADASNVTDLLDAVLFVEVDGSWYLTAIAPHDRDGLE